MSGCARAILVSEILQPKLINVLQCQHKLEETFLLISSKGQIHRALLLAFGGKGILDLRLMEKGRETKSTTGLEDKREETEQSTQLWYSNERPAFSKFERGHFVRSARVFFEIQCGDYKVNDKLSFSY